MNGKPTPMMQHYLNTKEKYKDCILFYRLGDFYEMFFDDAVTVSRELQLTLTGKSCGLDERAPMCGVPHHAADFYIKRLIEKGYKVAVCEQLEDPALAKGIVKRDVVRIVTPGTLLDSSMLASGSNNYLASVFDDGKETGLAYCDISTGELIITNFSGERRMSDLLDEIVRLNVKEAVICDSEQAEDLKAEISDLTDAYVTILPSGYYSADSAERTICSHFKVMTTQGLGIESGSAELRALGALFSYLLETQKGSISQLTRVQREERGGKCVLDRTAVRNLELVETIYDKKTEGSLIWVLDGTNTAMGSRLLKKWMREPLTDTNEINRRLDAVEVLAEDVLLRNDLSEEFKGVYDLERLGSRIAQGGVNARDMNAIMNSAALLPDIKANLTGTSSELLDELEENIDTLDDMRKEIADAIVDEPPVQLREGGLIKDGYSEDLDKLKANSAESLEWIKGLESRERERTGIKKLKLGYNKVFGYYLDVPKSSVDKVPDDYIRKQTLVNSERYVTEELKHMESIVLNAESSINKLEYEIFAELREKLRVYVPAVQKTAAAVAEADVLVSFAEKADENNYVRPLVDNGDIIDIKGGRHPVIEQNSNDAPFVSNDVYLDRSGSSMLLITGPNMSGKSTYMRQTALIVLMAQMGCFVPADSARIGVVDRIFTRIGASDNLAKGQSTFYVEMSELAYILNTATPKSLIILDEIGRGTSTYDGLSIAWAAADYLCSENRQIRTMFATHYHELTELEGRLPGLVNLNVAVSEEGGRGGDVVFLHKIEKGGASRSYGIHVAKIAGVPPAVLHDASEKLKLLESASEARNDRMHLGEEASDKPESGAGQDGELFNEGGAVKDSGSGADQAGDPAIGSGAVQAGDSGAGEPGAQSARENASKEEKTAEQMTMFDYTGLRDDRTRPLIEMIKQIDLMNITPAGAIAAIEEMKKTVDNL
ncbi:MAG: DNA mismatch repair protein MutS [Anaerovoracaceae bacterium]|jgi:DNA mismatch repair protein MutS